MQCAHTRQVWHNVFQRLQVLVPIPLANEVRGVVVAHKAVLHHGTAKNFDALAILCAWKLWKSRDAVVLNNVQQQRNMVQLTDDICDEFRKWSFGRRGVSGVFHVRVGIG